MTDILQGSTPTALELRTMLEEMVRKDLLGPAGGEEEEVTEPTISGRYIVGLLAPKGQQIVPDEQDDLAVGGDGDSQDGLTDTIAPQLVSMFPSSLGLTFTVDGSAPAIQITARWGAYDRVESPVLTGTAGEPIRVWKRRQVESTSEPIELKAGMLGPWFPLPDNQGVYVRGLCRRRDDAWSVTLFLVNAQDEPKVSKDKAWLFQPELVVCSPDGQAIFIKRRLPAELDSSDAEDRAMEMLYRRRVEFAVGHGVAVQPDLAPGIWDRATVLRTAIIPSAEVERMEPPTAEEIPLLGEAVFDMKLLAELPDGGFSQALSPLVQAYATWIDGQEAQLAAPPPDLAAYVQNGTQAIADCRETLARIAAGIAVLDQDPQAAEAFRFANRAMHRQRIRSIYAREVRQQKQPSLDAIDVPGNRSWRPFQLAFVLLNLPALADPLHSERSNSNAAIADLLWFPTGGGKTEAYLGVAAFTMAMRRLQGTLGGYSGLAGVAVLMRYTLRLLTLQQFQRATTLMCACELIRQEDPQKWGKEPFRIGLWVGQSSTPNWTEDSFKAVKEAKGLQWSGDQSGTPYQLTNCPWCGRPINPGQNMTVETYEAGRGRTFQYCSDKTGICPFSFGKSPNEGLPIVVVDEEIYRRLPALLIATVDKFAQMPWKGETQMLFGRVDGYCPRHGYRSPEIEDKDSHPKKGWFPAVQTQPLGPLRPPDLIIQDELHLISGPLGTLVGLYETVVDALCTWQIDGADIRPKVIASTATIRRARDQVNSLFLRQVKIFPPAALDAGDTFFARRQASSDGSPARRYIGICAPGARMRLILIRVYVAFMAAAQVLYEKHGTAADPWMTLVGYFNSMRELGGMRRVADDTVRTRLQKMDERGLSRRYIESWTIEELTSRRKASEIPKILDRLEAVFDPQARESSSQKGAEKVPAARRPLDLVLATNMISVGVDVNRLGLMVVASQPKATAEFIQATSRVGRAFPGLVCTVYNWARPRDLSHYERFGHYHDTFYQQVEALSVTPFSPRALDRGLAGILVSLVRLQGQNFNANTAAGQINRQHPYVTTALEAIAQRAGLVTASTSTADLVRQMLETRLDKWLDKSQATSGGAVLGYARPPRGGNVLGLLKKPQDPDRDIFTCLNSLRDVEPEVKLILWDDAMIPSAGQTPDQATEEVS